MKGRLKGLSISCESKKPIIALEVDAAATEIQEFADMELSVELKKWRNKRSLDANAYYHVLLGKLANAIGASTPFFHNQMLRRYGTPEIMDGKTIKVVVPDTDAATERIDNETAYHLYPTSDVREGAGGTFRTYVLLKGSHAFDTKEMSRLIDGIVSECKEAGIETMPPDEIAKMMACYKQRL